MARGSGLRARVAANLAAAVSLTFGLLAIASMAILQRAVRDEDRDHLHAMAALVGDELRTCHDDFCAERVVARAAQAGIAVKVSPVANGEAGASGVDVPVGDHAVHVSLARGQSSEKLRGALTALLVSIFVVGVALVVVGTMLFERGVVRRLARLDEDMERVERLELDPSLLGATGGDEIGRMGGTLRRMAERLREDKQRTSEYIARLEATNRTLREAQEGLARSERLATVGRLAAGVAHEIGNPVAAILGYLEILRRTGGAAPEEYVDRIDRETRRVDRIVRDLLDFARPQPLVAAPVDIATVVLGAARLVEPQPRWRQMSLLTTIEEGLPPVLAQEHYATQVLVNLLINAADACSGRGVVKIEARRAGDRVVIDVADDGPGISEENRTRIFDPFFTTKPPGEGAGLGLAITYRLMESFGGSIAVGAATPHGAIFSLAFRTAGG